VDIMTHFDVFNGDADGLCALHQLRLATPKNAVLVSGVKRDIALLQRVPPAQAGDSMTVLDISLAVNRDALLNLLERGVHVEYFDHHFVGDLPVHPRLTTTIDPSPGVCTGMLVDHQLGGRYRMWAVVAAFGDDLAHAAEKLALPLGLTSARLRKLEDLGVALAYNAYGDTEADLIVHPTALYRTLSRYPDPFDFMRHEPIFREISESRHDDLEMARVEKPELALGGATVHILPDTAWSRRVRGAFVNELASRHPDLAHAVLTHNAQHGYTVSVRAPRIKVAGADALCRKFPTGGGRVGAAGINHLPIDQLPIFVCELDQAFRQTTSSA
jgi:hypothetical protein